MIPPGISPMPPTVRRSASTAGAALAALSSARRHGQGLFGDRGDLGGSARPIHAPHGSWPGAIPAGSGSTAPTFRRRCCSARKKAWSRLQLPMRISVVHRHPTKSGLPLRSGLARLAAWSWMFKNFTVRDWQIFVTVYGQPLRLGKYSPGASEADKEVLWRAVAQSRRRLRRDHSRCHGHRLRLGRWCFRQRRSLPATGRLDRPPAQQSHPGSDLDHRGPGRQPRALAGFIARFRTTSPTTMPWPWRQPSRRTVVRWIVEINYGFQTVFPTLKFGRETPSGPRRHDPGAVGAGAAGPDRRSRRSPKPLGLPRAQAADAECCEHPAGLQNAIRPGVLLQPSPGPRRPPWPALMTANSAIATVVGRPGRRPTCPLNRSGKTS